MSVDIPTDTIVDSIRLDYTAHEIFATPDGSKLLVTGNGTHVYNTSDLSPIEIPVKSGYYYFDGSDNYGVLIAGKIYFIDPINLVPYDSVENPANITNLYLDQYYLDTVTDRFFESVFTLGDTLNVVYRFDCKTRTLVDSIVFPPHLGQFCSIAYNWLTNDLYIISGHPSGYSLFYQFDLDDDSIIVNPLPFVLARPYGSIAISPDGRVVYMIDSGHGMFGEFPIHPIWVIDALTHQPISWIPPYDSSGFTNEFFGQIILTPDNRWAYIGSNASSGGGVPIVVVDRQENRIVRRISPYLGFSPRIAMGPVPKN
jgi:hypothetical protein